MPIAQSSFYRSAKLPNKWNESIILENSHTGGYPGDGNNLEGMISDEFPIFDKERRGSTIDSPDVSLFPDARGRDFSLPTVRQADALGAALLNHYGQLHLALRAFQEPQMAKQTHLADQSRLNLPGDPPLRGDVAEIHHLGDIQRYRVPPPGQFRVRGQPHNPG